MPEGLPMLESARRAISEKARARNLREPRLPSGLLLRAPSDDGSGMAIRQT